MIGWRRRTTTVAVAALTLTLGVSGAASAVPAQGAGTATQTPQVAVTELDLQGIDAAALPTLPEVAPEPVEDTGAVAAAPAGAAARSAGPSLASAAATQDEPAPDVLTAAMDVAPFSVMGVTWDGTSADVVIRYRVRQAEVWSDWEAVAASDVAPDATGQDATGHRGATDALVAVDADGVQIWAEADPGVVTGLKVVLIDPGEDTSGTAAAASSTSEATGVVSTVSADATSVGTAAATAPTIIRRSEWGADESLRTCEPDLASSTLAAAVHHTASTNSYSAADVPGLLRGYLAYHTRSEAAGGRGWCDIGYNFLVDKYGRIFEGRAGSIEQAVVGVHTGGFNSRTLGVAAIGEYGAAGAPAEMLEGISQVIAWKFATHHIAANSVVTMVSGGGASKYPAGTAVTFSTIYGHRDAQQTSCPGQNLYNSLQAIRDRVAAISNAAVAVSPTGTIEVLRASSTAITVSGWVLDPDTTDPLTVTVLVDGSPTVVRADGDRPDLAASFPTLGTRHGFAVSIPASTGSRAVCIWAQNVAGGNDLLMGCQRMSVTTKASVGAVDTVSATTSAITVTGWALDPDTTDPIQVHIYLDGVAVRGLTADLPRPDVAAAYSNGELHGFSTSITADPGTHTLCVYAIDSNGGANPQLACRTVDVPAAGANLAPFGSLESVSVAGTVATVSGWALDPDTSDSIQVHVYLDGVAVRGLVASDARADVGAAYGKGDAHGFSTTVTVGPGAHSVCAYAIDPGLRGPNPQLGCRTVVVASATANRAPIGSLDAVSSTSSSLSVAGWVLDPDTTESIQTHVYVDGSAVAGVVASITRTDVGAAHGMGNEHGFAVTVPASAGAHTVCVYAIDSSLLGPNPQVGCRTVTVSNGAPFGALDVVIGGTGSVTALGWAIDPDTTDPVQVHVYVDGAALAGVVADGIRTDVGSAFGMGDAHGYAATVTVAAGVHTVCAYVIDSSLAGPNPQVGCRTVVAS